MPKHEAVSLARKDAGGIGVLAPFTSYTSYYTRMTGILQELASSGLDVMIYDIESAATATAPVLAASAIRGRLDGLIVMGERIDATWSGAWSSADCDGRGRRGQRHLQRRFHR